MAWLPIVERELRVALRKRRPVRSRLVVASAAAAGTLVFLLEAFVTDSRGSGRELHRLLCLAGAYFVLRTPSLTAGLFAAERRNQTLGLLFLSGLGPGEVFASKLLSAALIAVTDLLAMFPVLALPFLIGGVSFELFLATISALPNLLLFALAVSLLASVLTRDDGMAVVLASVLALLLCALPPLLHTAQAAFSVGGAASAWWLRLSPAYGPYLVWRGLGVGSWAEFWKNYWITLGWSGLCLGAAATALKMLWREREETDTTAHGRSRWHQFVHGNARWRERLARRWLQVNPFVWLVARDRQPATLAWLVVGGLIAVWLLCWAAWPKRWLSVPNFFITATLLNGSLRWIIHYTAAKTLGEPRRDGSYELLLTTPLQPTDLVWGEFEALRRHFQAVGTGVLALNVAMMLAGLVLRSWTVGALFVYLTIWSCLLWWAWRQSSYWRAALLVMWVSLNCGRPAHAVWRATGLNSWAWIWILCNLRYGLSRFPAFPTGSPSEIVMAVLVSGVLVGIALLTRGSADARERRLTAEFREIVREPLPDPNDRRFKRWNVRERFPWGWTIVQQQLHERVVRRQTTDA